ncbi:AraC family transcriptional regulator [Rapidithrix thailandica]|uniref:AraC family transcriptional regulator n=1 Tax=Rapidithrix thailandica TaxID=413964 RepID=A0AAW9S843_9BACT
MEEIYARNGGKADAPHRHHFYTILWSFTARGSHIIDFKEYPIRPNSLFLVAPDKIHQVKTAPNPTGISILFTPEFLQYNAIAEDFIANHFIFKDTCETPPLTVHENKAKKLHFFVEQMQALQASEAEYKYDSLGAYLKLFLIESFQACKKEKLITPQELHGARELLRKFRHSVEKHYSEFHKVKDYADQLHITPGYLNEITSKYVGKSAKEYIQNRIILEAKRLAALSPMSAKEIGYQLGFTDPAHFSKVFKGNAGQTLQQFKKSHKLSHV